MHLTLFVVVALLICWFNAALRSVQEALRRSEINFRSLVTNAPYGICRCDSTGTVVDANPALVLMLGYGSNSELVGHNLGNLYREPAQWFTLADFFRSQHRFNELVADWVRKDGSSIVVRLSGRAIRDERSPGESRCGESRSERHQRPAVSSGRAVSERRDHASAYSREP